MGNLPNTYAGGREVTMDLPDREWAALVMLRDTSFPDQSLEMMARKLVVDGLIANGVLKVTPDGKDDRLGEE